MFAIPIAAADGRLGQRAKTAAIDGISRFGYRSGIYLRMASMLVWVLSRIVLASPVFRPSNYALRSVITSAAPLAVGTVTE